MHPGKAFKCYEVRMQDVRRFHQMFYSNADINAQQNFILRHVTVETPKRRRARNINNHDESPKKMVTSTYHIPCLKAESSVVNVQVCKKLFTESLGKSRDRIQNVGRKFLYHENGA